MRLGCFGFSGDLAAIRRAGFDFAELDLMELSRMTDGEFREFVRRAGDSGLDFDAFSGFMPLTERIHSPAFSAECWLEHARRMADRTAKLGAKLWPLGAGKCRSIPERADPAAARERVKTFFGGIAKIVAPCGVKLCIEPLGPNNSNFLNTVGEAAEFAAEMGLANCATMCDMRHMVALDEPFEDIATWRESVWHAHIDYPLGFERRFPNPEDGWDYRPYLLALHRAGYAGPLTVEATSYGNLEREGAACAKMLRRLWEE
ncbi:MAG: sugar phosphate isomerase/epimerase [Clostridiales bacterium]|nr:sugar phosphate isomerase/epimerase [Clostridiales bacterium]